MEPTPNAGTNPGSRPRRGLAIGLVFVAVAGVVTAASLVGTSPTPAGAVGLEAFSSCTELEAWGETQMSRNMAGQTVDEDMAAREDMAAAAPAIDAVGSTIAPTAAQESLAGSAGTDGAGDAASTGGTNVVVEGVDELDLVERISEDRALFTSPTALVLVDLTAGARIARVAAAPGAQVTYDDESGIAWVVGSSRDGTGTEVRRVAVTDDALIDRGSWTTSGYLVTARRVGDLLHVVATEGFSGPAEPIPFEDGPVPCDQVLHPSGPSDPTATLIATLPAGGDLQPVRSTEVVGSGQLVHLTPDAAYLATPQWDGDGSSTTIHRFALAELAHTGSGRVPGQLLNDFSMSDHDGYLRVAITAGGMVTGQPVPMEDFGGDVATDSGGAGSDGAMAEEGSREPAIAPAPPAATTTPPTTVVDSTTTTEVTTTTEATTSTTEATTTTDATTTTASTTTTTTAQPPVEQPGPNDPLNRVLVLDTDGDLDVVGQTPWFGLPGETLQGIRFDGPTAYAVTYLQTDPFYVLDLADPTAPRIAGEVKLPGFSSYLHPVGEGLVVGFGPGEDGRAAAKLFDVSNPSAPQVVDTIVLGDDAPIAYDHHAFTDLGEGRFATPVTRWGASSGGCAIPAGAPDGPAVDDACAPSQVATEVVELAVEGTDLVELSRTPVALAEPASRVLALDDGWALLAGTTVALVDADGELRTSVDLT